jgi:hypothetical protein
LTAADLYLRKIIYLFISKLKMPADIPSTSDVNISALKLLLSSKIIFVSLEICYLVFLDQTTVVNISRWAVHGHKPKLREKSSTLTAAQKQDNQLPASSNQDPLHATQEQDTGLHASQEKSLLLAAQEQDTGLHASEDHVVHKQCLTENFREEFVEIVVMPQYDLTNFTSMISLMSFIYKFFCLIFPLQSSYI